MRFLLLALFLAGCAAPKAVARGVEAKPVTGQFKNLNELLYAENVTGGDVAVFLAALPNDERVRQATHLDRRHQALLWRLSEGNAPYTPAELAPADAAPLQTFPYEGQNDQLAYRSFQKVFYRQHDGSLAGYNVSDAAWFAGPGYYLVATDATGVYVDYRRVPTEKPEGQAEIEENGFPVYGGMKDYLRRVYGDILIGRAYRGDDETDNYFVLAR